MVLGLLMRNCRWVIRRLFQSLPRRKPSLEEQIKEIRQFCLEEGIPLLETTGAVPVVLVEELRAPEPARSA
jgi:hypothetical protein